MLAQGRRLGAGVVGRTLEVLGLTPGQSTGFARCPAAPSARPRGKVPPEVMDRCAELDDEIVEIAQSNA